MGSTAKHERSRPGPLLQGGGDAAPHPPGRLGAPQSRVGWILPVLLAFLGGCDQSPLEMTREDGPPLLAVIGGGDQRGVPGQPLLHPVRVQVTDEAGRPVPGVPLGVEVVSGGGHVTASNPTSDGNGLLFFTWTLGPGEEEENVALVRLRSSGMEGSGVPVRAGILEPHRRDVVRIHGPAELPLWIVPVTPFVGPLPLRVLQVDEMVFQTILPRGGDELAVFSGGNPPEIVRSPSGAGPDTLDVHVREPFPVPLRIVVAHGPFEERRAVVEWHLAAAERIWRESGAGLTLGAVELIDRTGGGATREFAGPPCNPNESLVDGSGRPIEVSYVLRVGNLGGYACLDNGFAVMAESSARFQNLLAHELGHLFTLPHVANQANVMWPQAGGSLSAGQIFRIHFHARSVLNRLYDLTPPETRRNCEAVLNEGRVCFPDEFYLPPG
jgi:hypothetical protein